MISKLRLTLVAGVCSLAVLVGGCTTDPYTGQQQASNTGVGIGLGAASGAVLGQLIGGNTQGTLIGAGVGALVGGIAGGYMDNQAAELRNQLQGTGVQIMQNGGDIQLIMPSDITFAFNSSDIKPRFYSTLNSVAIVLRKYNNTIVKVVGYTDNVGNAEYNQVLSEKRARSVATYLMSQGTNPNRYAVSGRGERRPVADNSTDSGRAQNRRVEIIIHPIN